MSRSRIRLRRPAVVAAFILAVVPIALFAAAAAAQPQPRSQALARAIQMHRQNSERLLAVKDVLGTATGVAPDGRFAVKVYTRRPGVAGIPRNLDGVPVVVEAAGEFFALQQPLHRAPRPPHDMRRPPHRQPPSRRDLPPSVTIVAPADGATVSGEVAVVAHALDDHGVTAVQFFVDSSPLQSDSDGDDGWSVVWNSAQVADGRHTVTAAATDTSGQTASDRVGVLVDNEPGPFSPDGRPSPIGVSTGNENECSAGTIACRVKDARGNVYALSNNHVYARTNEAAIGEAIVQPGLYDSNCALLYSDQVIGGLADFVPIDFRRRASNTVDAAIGLSTTKDLGNSTPSNGYGTSTSLPVAAAVDQKVRKYGRTTFLTKGSVSGIEGTVYVNYDGRTARFTNQIIISGAQGFIGAGDSGSLLVTDQREPVGLLFAGTEDGSTAIANPIQSVLDAFGVAIDGQ